MDVYGASSLSCLPFKYVHSTYFTLNKQSSSLATIDNFGIAGVWSLPWPVLLPGRDWKLVERRPTCGAAHSSTAMRRSSWSHTLSKDWSRIKAQNPLFNACIFCKKNISSICGVFAAGRRWNHPASRKCTSKNHWPVSWACFGKPMVIQSDLNFEVYQFFVTKTSQDYRFIHDWNKIKSERNK